MSDPVPQPPQPHPISAAQWLSLLSPSAFTIAVPLVLSTLRTLTRSLWMDEPVGLLLLNLFVGIVLCFVFGVRLEKWRRGSVQNDFRALGYGFLILVVNTFISFAGCTFAGVFRV
jgi:hypothetical protein